MRRLRTVFAVFILTLFTGLFAACEDDKSSNQGGGTLKSDVTPKGVKLKTASSVDASMKDVIDRSLTELFKDAKVQGYSQGLEHSAYTVEVADDCVLTPNKNLAFVLNAPNYNNTEWDINPDPNIGQVYAAEQVVGSDYIKVCRGEEALMLNTVRYGGEHEILRKNDSQKYAETLTHTNGKGHPLIPQTNE